MKTPSVTNEIVKEVVSIQEEVKTQETSDFNIDKLAYAVALHETKDCGLDYGASAKNNCFGIGKFENGKRVGFKAYNTPGESYEDFKRIWTTYYGEMPNLDMARKYSGNDRAEEWLGNVLYFYKTM